MKKRRKNNHHQKTHAKGSAKRQKNPEYASVPVRSTEKKKFITTKERIMRPYDPVASGRERDENGKRGGQSVKGTKLKQEKIYLTVSKFRAEGCPTEKKNQWRETGGRGQNRQD